jgi:hypothetical protein
MEFTNDVRMYIELKGIKDKKKLQPEDCCDVRFSGRKLGTYERNLSSSPAASGFTAKKRHFL